MIGSPCRVAHRWIKLMIRCVATALLLLAGAGPFAFEPTERPQGPVPIIYDTDIGSDCDDAGALAILHALANRGEAEVLACMVNEPGPNHAPCVDALNTYFGRPSIPIGVLKVPGEGRARYGKAVADRQPHDLESEAQAPDAVVLYRKILASQPDRSVTIVSVGFLGNLAGLLKSGADSFSDSTGQQLVQRKVRELVIMGCWWPRGKDPYNFKLDYTSAQHVVANWPGPIMLTDLGKDIIAGNRLKNELPEDHVLRIAYTIASGPKNPDLHRCSWDHVAVLYAVRGLGDLFRAEKGGTARLLDDGTSVWEATEGGQHSYLLKARPAGEIAATIEELMIAACREANK